jgi:hypothetical protein
MLLIHPIVQGTMILLTFYVLFLGLQRFRSQHLGQRAPFKWKRHVRLGLTALAIILGGLFWGAAMTATYWGGPFMVGVHATVGVVIGILILVGIGTGLYMNARKRKRTLLPLLHGLNNLVIIGLGVSQAVTGWGILNTFVFGL